MAMQLAEAPPHQRHRPEQTLLYALVEQHYPAFIAALAAAGSTLPRYVEREFEDLRIENRKHKPPIESTPTQRSAQARRPGAAEFFILDTAVGQILGCQPDPRAQHGVLTLTLGLHRFGVDERFKEEGIYLRVMADENTVVNPWSVDEHSKSIKLDSAPGNFAWPVISATVAQYTETKEIPGSFNVDVRRARAELLYQR